MNTRKKSELAWEHLRKELGDTSPRATARVSRSSIPHPRDAGARPTATWPVGQVADYAIDSSDSSAPLVIQEFPSHFEAFIDGVQVAEKAAQIAQENPTAAMYIGGALVGGVLGSSLSNRREGALLGAGLGLVLAALVDSSLESKRRR
jgi:hypothetical protein